MKASRNVCFFCRSCQKKCFKARSARSFRVSREARSAKPRSAQAREVIESVASIKCDLSQSKVWFLMLLAERSHQMMLDANKLDARCSMLDPCDKKDTKQRFQKRFSTKVGKKSRPKSVIFDAFAPKRHQIMLDANKPDAQCSMLNAPCNHATKRCKKKLSEKVLNKSRWKKWSKKSDFHAFGWKKSSKDARCEQARCLMLNTPCSMHPCYKKMQKNVFRKSSQQKKVEKVVQKEWFWHFCRKKSSKDARCKQARYPMLNAQY